jgi:hypothetical protein
MAIVNKIQTHDNKMDDITITEKIHISLTLKCHFIVDEHESNTSKFVATYHLNEKLSLKINVFFLMIMFTVHIMLIH